MSNLYVTVLTALVPDGDAGKVQEQKVYAYTPEGPSPAADLEFERLKKTYGAANVCMASRTIIRTIARGHEDVSMSCKTKFPSKQDIENYLEDEADREKEIHRGYHEPGE